MSGRIGGINKYPSLNVRIEETRDSKLVPANYKAYEDQFVTYDNKENMMQNYNRYRQAVDNVRRSIEPV